MQEDPPPSDHTAFFLEDINSSCLGWRRPCNAHWLARAMSLSLVADDSFDLQEQCLYRNQLFFGWTPEPCSTESSLVNDTGADCSTDRSLLLVQLVVVAMRDRDLLPFVVCCCRDAMIAINFFFSQREILVTSLMLC